MTRLIALPLTVLICVGGYLLMRPPALESPRQQALLGSLPVRSAVPATPSGSALPPAPAPAPAVVPVLTPLPATGLALAPSAIGAGYGQDPAIVRTLVMHAGGAKNPPQHIASRPKAKQWPLLHLPAVLPATTVTVPIMMYHHVSTPAATVPVNYGLTVTDSDFAAQLAYLHQHGYHTILLRQVFAALYQHATLPPKPIVLTFDDGYLDNYTDALPLLRRWHDVAEFNIISAYPGITLGVNRYMTWAQLKRLVKDGMEIGSHTVDHQDLGLLPEVHVRFELRDSRNILQLKLGIPVQFLAYPSGQPFLSESAAQQQELLTLLPEYGYVGALLDGPLVTAVQDAQQPYELRRIRVAGGEALAGFAASLGQ